MSAFGDKNVCWLDVSMNDTLRVCCVKSIGYVDGNIEQALQFHGPPRNSVLERFASRYSMAMKALPLPHRCHISCRYLNSSAPTPFRLHGGIVPRLDGHELSLRRNLRATKQ